MFILTTLSDLVQIPPHEFYRKDREEIEDLINEKYSNKVVQNIGLCIALYDLLSASDGLISHGTGNVNVNVTFRMIIFRPFKGEIILGRIDRQDITGISVSTEFFDDLHVPAEMLFPNSLL
jgi:DNA-directed RNA polymerase III subunit RPC8